MPKKPKRETPVEDAFHRLGNLYHFPLGQISHEAIKEVLKALHESTDEEYFERIKQIKLCR